MRNYPNTPPRALMEHLSALGYKGSLQIPHNMTL